MSVETVAGAAELSPERIAELHSIEAKVLAGVVVAEALSSLGQVDPQDLWGSWLAGLADRVYGLVSFGQESAADRAGDYVDNILSAQGLRISRPALRPLGFAGRSADGGSLDSALAAPVRVMQARLATGGSFAEALTAGQFVMERIVTTELADAVRAADETAGAVTKASQPTSRGQRPVAVGYVRMINGATTCGRCALLAGKFYRWSAGFERHPMCDCTHLPCTVAAGQGLVFDPDAYFESLTPAEQDERFGKGNAEAIRAGADMGQVVNASTRRKGAPPSVYVVDDRQYTRAGTTRRGYYGGKGSRERRPTPGQIIRDAGGDIDAAREQLARFGYIVS